MTNKKYSEEEQKLFKLYSKATKKQAVWKGKITQGFKAWKKEQEVDETEDMEDAIKEVKEAEEIDEFDELLDDLENDEEYEAEKEDVEEDELEIEELSEDEDVEDETEDSEVWILHEGNYYLSTKKFAEVADVVVQAINSRFRNNDDLAEHSILLKINGNRKQRFFDETAVETISKKLKVNVYEQIKNQIPK